MWIIALIIVVLAVIFIPVRLAVLHPFKTFYYTVVDIYRYYRYHKKDLYEAGKLYCLFAHFGGGKTLTGVHEILRIYNRYNNKTVWDKNQHKLVNQQIHVLSNVSINGIRCEALTSLTQIVNYAYKMKKIDKEQGTRTVILVLLDEASVQLNSRNFKDNINPEFLNALLTSRHFNMSMFYTSQKFKLTDALLRNVTQTCVHCRKLWRFVITTYYDADQLELAGDMALIKPVYCTGYFATDKLFGSYDTLATVDTLKKSFDQKDMLSEKEILELRGQLNPDVDAITQPSRKLRKFRKRAGA